MLHIYLWFPGGEAAWGHASMWIEYGPIERQRYVSWWPLNAERIENLMFCNPAWPNSPSRDVRLEGRLPDFELRLPNTRGQLDERQMVLDWDFWTRRDCYIPDARNCCTTVATLLRESGGARRIADWSPRLYWDPEALHHYLLVLWRAGVPMQRYDTVRMPPDHIPRAPHSIHFRAYETHAVTP
jgi:hypothetical protein